MAHSAVSGLPTAGEAPAPGENPGGDGLVGLIGTALERVGWTACMVVLGMLVTLAGATWMWRRMPKGNAPPRDGDRSP
ncbi:hypothetical protein [Streptomyces venezuelae]|uniref:hypothetical protein n=1 Tax=Streptomyces venezuelae TaxID=54571 RepID=UPI003322E94B